MCSSSLKSGGMVQSCISAAAIVEIRKARSLLVAMHGQKIGWEEAKTVIQIVDFIRLPDDSYLPEVGTELLSLLDSLSALFFITSTLKYYTHSYCWLSVLHIRCRTVTH